MYDTTLVDRQYVWDFAHKCDMKLYHITYLSDDTFEEWKQCTRCKRIQVSEPIRMMMSGNEWWEKRYKLNY